MSHAAQLRGLIRAPGLIVAPGVYDGMSAALVQVAGFEAAYMTGAGVSASAVGVPDIGLATMPELVGQAAVINRRLKVPLIADADTGFGDPTNVYRTVLEYERAGVAAIQLEDQVFPKRCGHLDDKAVLDRAEFVQKIRAAIAARNEMLVVARTDARATHGIDEALSRARDYAAAGADIIFVEAPQSIDEISAIPRAVDAPVLFNLVARGKSPDVSLDQLREFGYRIVIAPGVAMSGAMRGIEASLELLRNGVTAEAGAFSPRELFEKVGLNYWEGVRSSFNSVEVGAHA